jgi:hypothetical protein
MLRRFVISSCLLLAFVIMQAHNFVPHVHEEKQLAKHAHHHDHDDHDDHHDDKDEGDKTAHHQSHSTDLTHSAEFGKVMQKPHFEIQVIQTDIFIGTFLRLYDKMGSLKNPPRPHPPDKEPSLHIIFLSHSTPLRAPPASSCLS